MSAKQLDLANMKSDATLDFWQFVLETLDLLDLQLAGFPTSIKLEVDVATRLVLAVDSMYEYITQERETHEGPSSEEAAADTGGTGRTAESEGC